MNSAIMTMIDNDLMITQSFDTEVMFRWYSMGLYLMYNPVYSPAETWVGQMGRVKYIKPIYKALVDSGQQTTAEAWNTANINFYQAITETEI